jgi:hypothetical protein
VRLQNELTAEEATILRRHIKEGPSTTIPLEGRYATHRIAVLPADVEEIHRRKRIAALLLLLEVIRRGTPQDVLTAAGFADMLEKGESGVIIALGSYDMSPDEVDRDRGDNTLATRELMREEVEAMIAKAQGKGEAGR